MIGWEFVGCSSLTGAAAASSPSKSRTPLKEKVSELQKPTPTSSIKDIRENMWQDNKEDWRVSSALDY